MARIEDTHTADEPYSRALKDQVRRLVLIRFFLFIGMMCSYFIGILGTVTYTMGEGVMTNVFAVGCLNLFILFGNSYGGALLDKMGPQKHLRVSVGLLVVCGLCFQLLTDSVREVLMGSMFFGFSWGVADLVARSYPAYLTSDAGQLKRINASISLASNISTVAGPLVGGAIALVAPPQTVFLFCALCALVALVPGSGFKPLCDPVRDERGAQAKEGVGDKGKSSVRLGFETVFASTALTLLFWSTMLSFFGYSAFDPLESLYYRDVLHVGADWMGWLSAVAGIGGVLGVLLAGRVPTRHVNVRTLLVVLASMGAGCLLYVATASPYIAMAGQLILGVFNGMYAPLKDTLVQLHAPLSRVGRVSAAMNTGYGIAGTIPLFCAPVLAAILGVQGTLIAASLLVTVIPLLILVFHWRTLAHMVRDEREAETRE